MDSFRPPTDGDSEETDLGLSTPRAGSEAQPSELADSNMGESEMGESEDSSPEASVVEVAVVDVSAEAVGLEADVFAETVTFEAVAFEAVGLESAETPEMVSAETPARVVTAGGLPAEVQADLDALGGIAAGLDSVEAVLRLIDAGTYGHCSLCGRPIDDERLAADPLQSQCGQHLGVESV